jgi:hypothetical protein
MTINPDTLPALSGKKVTLTSTGGEATEGLLEAATPLAVIFKAKGKSNPTLIEVGDIDTIELLAEKPTVIKQSALKDVDAGSVRRHLLDRHGLPLSVVNEMTDDEAIEAHDQIDHSDLGHRHDEA